MGQVLVTRTSPGVDLVTLSNPSKKNALDIPMIGALTAALRGAAADASCRVVVLRGEGTTFCAGRDTEELANSARGESIVSAELEAMSEMFLALAQCPKVVVTAIEGYALGLGAVLAMLSDIALCAPSARFGFPEAKFGIPPTFTAAVLDRKVPARVSRWLLFSGSMIGASEAVACGLATRVAAEDALEAELASALRSLRLSSPHAIALTKQLLEESGGHDWASIFAMARKTTMLGINTPDAIEGRLAGREKRPPAWAGEN